MATEIIELAGEAGTKDRQLFHDEFGHYPTDIWDFGDWDATAFGEFWNLNKPPGATEELYGDCWVAWRATFFQDLAAIFLSGVDTWRTRCSIPLVSCRPRRSGNWSWR